MKILSSIKSCSSSRKILTGIQPTGNLHLGNYLGSVHNLYHLQAKLQFSQAFLSIVDYHSLTTVLEHQHSQIKLNQQIGRNTFNMAKLLICSDLDLENKITLFVQSKVKEHAELCWILSCFSPHHWLNSMIQFKEKGHENSGLGLYSYPILMSADILLYKATHVPVGQDQQQHLELCRKISQRFNTITKHSVFPIPQYVVAKNPKVMSLVDPIKKMSKSERNDRSRINLSDSPSQIQMKIKKALTDSNSNEITYDPQNRKGLANLLNIYSTLKGEQTSLLVEQLKNENMKSFKDKLTMILIQEISKIQYKMKEVTDEEVNSTLKRGQIKARTSAQKTIKEVKQILKLIN